MRAFAQKPKTAHQTKSARSAIPGRSHFVQGDVVNSILHLQRTIGNRAVQRLLAAHTVNVEGDSTTADTSRFNHDFSRIPVHAKVPVKTQTKLMVNTPGDAYEQEADRIADQVTATPAHSAVSGPPPRVQRFSGQSNWQMDAAPASVDQALASPGRPLDPALRQDMEQRFDYDFSRVRVHSDAAAEQSAQDANAQAYTVGHDIVFGAGRFAPGIHDGRRLLAHELTHVVQQHNHHPRIQRQPSATLLTPAAAAAAVADVTNRYDEDSIRTLESFSGQASDGVFDAADAEALAKFQQAFHLTPNGKADVATLDAILRVVGPTPAKRSAVIHLVIDHANIDVSGALAVVYDPNVTAASDIDTLPGGVSTIQIGNRGFASYRVMVAEIRRRLVATPAASPVTPVPPAVFTDALFQKTAIFFNTLRVNDPRSIRLLQGALGSKATGQWDVDLVRHVAAKQQTLGLTPAGTLDESTLAAIATEMIANGSEDGVLQLIVDYYDLDRSHAFNIVFDPNPPPGHMNDGAETTSAGPGAGLPGVVHVFPLGFAQPFAGLVHTVAHELGHVQQIIQGIVSLNVREFLSEGIEIESKGMPAESIESEADIDLMIQNQLPAHPGLLQDAARMLSFWVQMTAAEKQAHHQRYKDLRSSIVNRIATEGSSSQKTKLAPFVARLQAADSGVP